MVSMIDWIEVWEKRPEFQSLSLKSPNFRNNSEHERLVLSFPDYLTLQDIPIYFLYQQCADNDSLNIGLVFEKDFKFSDKLKSYKEGRGMFTPALINVLFGEKISTATQEDEFLGVRIPHWLNGTTFSAIQKDMIVAEKLNAYMRSLQSQVNHFYIKNKNESEVFSDSYWRNFEQTYLEDILLPKIIKVTDKSDDVLNNRLNYLRNSTL